MPHLHKYDAHPWGQRVWFTQDEKTLRRVAKNWQLNVDLEGSLGLCWSSTGPYVIWVKPGCTAPILVHECTHAALAILEYCGIDPRSGDGEPMCYLLQRMLEAFLPHLLP